MTHVPNVVLVLLRNYVIEVHFTQLLVKVKVMGLNTNMSFSIVITRDPMDSWKPVSTENHKS